MVGVAIAIRRRLEALGLEQKGLAAAAQVTQSYVSQLLRAKKLPPDPGRTDIYKRMDRFLKLPPGALGRLAGMERRHQREQNGGVPPLFEDVRALVLAKCAPTNRAQIKAIFEQQPFGELERLVTQTLLDVTQDVVRAELDNPRWIRRMAKRSRRAYQGVRLAALEFLEADVHHLSPDHRAAFLEPLVTSWDVDLNTFAIVVAVDHPAPGASNRRFAMVEQPSRPVDGQSGFKAFRADPVLSAMVTDDELVFLRRLPLGRRQATALYYYRELQNLRDPLHFVTK
jgi:transcriptional regulator with XRE-family HTH domain